MKAIGLAVQDYLADLLKCWIGWIGVVIAVAMGLYIEKFAPVLGERDLQRWMVGALVLGWGFETWRKKDWRMLLPIVLGTLIIWLSPNRIGY